MIGAKPSRAKLWAAEYVVRRYESNSHHSSFLRSFKEEKEKKRRYTVSVDANRVFKSIEVSRAKPSISNDLENPTSRAVAWCGGSACRLPIVHSCTIIPTTFCLFGSSVSFPVQFELCRHAKSNVSMILFKQCSCAVRKRSQSQTVWPFATNLYSKSLVDGDYGRSEATRSTSKAMIQALTMILLSSQRGLNVWQCPPLPSLH